MKILGPQRWLTCNAKKAGRFFSWDFHVSLLTWLLLLVLCLSTGCKAKSNLFYSESKDSTYVEVNNRIITIYDTVTVSVPRDSIVIVTRDSINVITTERGTSTVELLSDGSFRHSLVINDTTVYVPVEVVAEVSDTTKVTVSESTEIVYQEVEKKLSIWQRIRLVGFWILLFLLLGFVIHNRLG